jgi:hypothetical protein
MAALKVFASVDSFTTNTNLSWLANRNVAITIVTVSSYIKVIGHFTELQDSYDLINIVLLLIMAEIIKSAMPISDLCFVSLGTSTQVICSTVDLLEATR